MAGLKLYTGNRLESLVGKMADVLRTPLPSPLDPEVIVVQSRGMERWVSMALAQRHGVCANYRYPFPRVFVNETMQSVLGEAVGDPAYDPAVMSWKIMKRLPSLISKPGFESLRNYLEDGGESLKRYQLARRIAHVFDQYLVFRPDMIAAWEKGACSEKEDPWQASVFMDMKADASGIHAAEARSRFISRIRKTNTPPDGMPARISIFGISSLPRFYMEVFHELSRLLDVHLFLMNPCREFWFDIRSDRQITRTVGKPAARKGGAVSGESLYLERGNSLLASMGTMGREFLSSVLDFETEEWEAFEDPGEGCLLHAVQSDILNLRDRAAGDARKSSADLDDRSICIHACHSPMREVEVLHDQLLAMFEADLDLQPRDILVMTPDIDTYAPFISAVFALPPEDGAADDSRHIPFSIADRSIRRESRIAEGLLAILDLCGSRYSAPSVLALLDIPAIRDRFGLSEADIEKIRHWVAETGIRWGIDGENRRRLGLPPYAENTWKAGLERLLLGYAMPGGEEQLFAGILPYDHIEGDDALILGRFLEFTERLFRHTETLGRPGTLDEWSGRLNALLAAFFAADGTVDDEMQAMRRVFGKLSEMMGLAHFTETVELTIVRSYLEEEMDQQGFGSGFMTGDVTFCAMLPMRSIPFKVICMIGMNNSSYPRQSHTVGFDLMVRHPRPGDRSRRHDDRYLFLEALLSVRSCLYVSYVGQSIQDNSAIPPSVLVSELLDYLDQGFEIPGVKSLSDHLITGHRLQAFNPAYFRRDTGLFSYSRENCRAAARLLQPGRQSVPWIRSGLSEPPPEWKTLDVATLVAFFRNPSRFLLERRLQLTLDDPEVIIDDTEPFSIRGLDRYGLEQRLMEKALAGQDLEDLWSSVRASGRLPHGAVGSCQYEQLGEGVRQFVESSRPFLETEALEPLDVTLDLSGFALSGRINGIYGSGVIHYRYAAIKGLDCIRAWLYHLMLNTAAPSGYPRITVLLGKGASWRFEPVEGAHAVLSTLLDLYWKGLSKPLKLFPDAAWEYAGHAFTGKRDRARGAGAALKKWAGGDYMRGEGDDAAYRLCFREQNPIDEEFFENAGAVFEKLVAHISPL